MSYPSIQAARADFYAIVKRAQRGQPSRVEARGGTVMVISRELYLSLLSSPRSPRARALRNIEDIGTGKAAARMRRRERKAVDVRYSNLKREGDAVTYDVAVTARSRGASVAVPLPPKDA